MTLIWDIKMHIRTDERYQVTIRGPHGRTAKGVGQTAYDAYHHAELQMVIKPACEWMKI